MWARHVAVPCVSPQERAGQKADLQPCAEKERRSSRSFNEAAHVKNMPFKLSIVGESTLRCQTRSMMTLVSIVPRYVSHLRAMALVLRASNKTDWKPMLGSQSMMNKPEQQHRITKFSAHPQGSREFPQRRCAHLDLAENTIVTTTRPHSQLYMSQ